MRCSFIQTHTHPLAHSVVPRIDSGDKACYIFRHIRKYGIFTAKSVLQRAKYNNSFKLCIEIIPIEPRTSTHRTLYDNKCFVCLQLVHDGCVATAIDYVSCVYEHCFDVSFAVVPLTFFCVCCRSHKKAHHHSPNNTRSYGGPK